MLMFQEFLDSTVWPALITVLGTLVTAGAAFAVKFIKEKAGAVKVVWARDVMLLATDAAHRAVETVNQTMVDAARESPGGLTKFDAKLALQRASQLAVRQLGQDGMAALAKAVGSSELADLVVADLVESAVYQTKIAVDTPALVR